MTTVSRWNTPAYELRSLQVGDHTVTYLPDGDVQLDPRGWLPDSTDDDWAVPHRSSLLDASGYLAAPIGGLLVEYGGRSILIDAGFGPRRWQADMTHHVLGTLQGGDLEQSLRAAGKSVSDLDLIAFTHLHDDHFGWVFAAPESPFHGIRLAASKPEWAWSSGHAAGNRTELGDGDEVFPGVTAWVTPGHTPGHTSYVISSAGQRLIAFGDVFHSAAQLERPEWRVTMDVLPAEAVATRGSVLTELARPGTLAFGNHFSDVQFGRIGTSSPLLWEPVHAERAGR
ncbi:MBL fold metallo-hydrolase [Streptomyces niveus]|uniref:MBL fold metallo-hydrolase n=1 Tax=Streptomyces niveus TaxID=193462 RepID=UPI00341ACC93